MPDLLQIFASDGPLWFVTAAVEILLLAYLFFQLLLSIRGTRAAPVAIGLGSLALLYFAADELGMNAVSWLMGQVAPYTVVALLIIFQTEIRRTLRSLALRFRPSRSSAGQLAKYEYEDVIFATSQLAQSKTGALIVLEREAGLRTFIQSGVSLDARLSSALLVSIFQRRSPLHDGGVIIQKGRIAAASCFLPLSTTPGLITSLGTRHRAAIGITEESDGLAIVVSETDGRISVAFAGNIDLGISMDRLRLRMIQYFGPVVAPPVGKEPAPEEPLVEPEFEPIAVETKSDVTSVGSVER